MHLIRTDLYLKRLSVRPDQCGMKRLVVVWLWHGNIILKSSRNRLIDLMDHSQSRIAITLRIHNNTDGKQIIYLFKLLSLCHHLFINTKIMLGTPINGCIYACLFDMASHLCHNIFDKFFSLYLSGLQLFF